MDTKNNTELQKSCGWMHEMSQNANIKSAKYRAKGGKSLSVHRNER